MSEQVKEASDNIDLAGLLNLALMSPVLCWAQLLLYVLTNLVMLLITHTGGPGHLQ